MIHTNGYAQIVGRLKDMIIRGGENIYPREIEELLHTHEDIVEAQVILYIHYYTAETITFLGTT